MEINTIREIVMGFYPFPKWKRRVEAMNDDQVVAIYHAKLEKVREQGATDMQLQLKQERR